MRCAVLASDYDGTLARGGRVDDATWDAVDRLRASERHLVLVTGREIDDLLNVCDRMTVSPASSRRTAACSIHPRRASERFSRRLRRPHSSTRCAAVA
jgi:hypothetical protein